MVTVRLLWVTTVMAVLVRLLWVTTVMAVLVRLLWVATVMAVLVVLVGRLRSAVTAVVVLVMSWLMMGLWV